MVKLTISMAIFNGYVKLPEGNSDDHWNFRVSNFQTLRNGKLRKKIRAGCNSRNFKKHPQRKLKLHDAKSFWFALGQFVLWHCCEDFSSQPKATGTQQASTHSHKKMTQMTPTPHGIPWKYRADQFLPENVIIFPIHIIFKWPIWGVYMDIPCSRHHHTEVS